MLSKNDMRIGSFYSLDNMHLRLYDFDNIAYFRVNGNIISKDFCKLEAISFDENWKNKILNEGVIVLWKYFNRQYVHEVQRDYFNDFKRELKFNVRFDEDKILF